MTKWDYLIEGKALGPPDSVTKVANGLADHISRTLPGWFEHWVEIINTADDFNRALDDLEARLLKKNDDISIGTRRDKYGKKRIKVAYSFARKMGAILVIPDPDDPDYAEIMKDGFDFILIIRMDIDELATVRPDTIKPFVNLIRYSIVHEMTHAMDPKVQPAFVVAQEKRRTRKGYPIITGPKNPEEYPDTWAGYARDFERYVTSPHEQETWTRDIARRMIYGLHRKYRTVDKVGEMIRKPPKAITGFGLKYSSGEKEQSVLSIWARSPNRWKRFLLTLLDEYEIYKKDPEAYMRYSAGL